MSSAEYPALVNSSLCYHEKGVWVASRLLLMCLHVSPIKGPWPPFDDTVCFLIQGNLMRSVSSHNELETWCGMCHAENLSHALRKGPGIVDFIYSQFPSKRCNGDTFQTVTSENFENIDYYHDLLHMSKITLSPKMFISFPHILFSQADKFSTLLPLIFSGVTWVYFLVFPSKYFYCLHRLLQVL